MMKNKKRLQNQVIQMPAPAFSSKLKIEKEEKSDRLNEHVHGEVSEKLIEEIGKQLDAYFATTGEPITAALNFSHHALEAIEMISGTGARNGAKPRTIIVSSRQRESEDDNELF